MLISLCSQGHIFLVAAFHLLSILQDWGFACCTTLRIYFVFFADQNCSSENMTLRPIKVLREAELYSVVTTFSRVQIYVIDLKDSNAMRNEMKFL